MQEMDTQVNKNDSQAKPIVHTSVEWEQDTENTPVYAVVSAVAEVEDTDPVDLPPLYNAIDPESLNSLFTSQSNPVAEQITFQYAGYSIVVRGSGEVEVQTA